MPLQGNKRGQRWEYYAILTHGTSPHKFIAKCDVVLPSQQIQCTPFTFVGCCVAIVDCGGHTGHTGEDGLGRMLSPWKIPPRPGTLMFCMFDMVSWCSSCVVSRYSDRQCLFFSLTYILFNPPVQRAAWSWSLRPRSRRIRTLCNSQIEGPASDGVE